MATVREYLKEGRENAITRRELIMLTGLTDREIREEIRHISMEEVPVINLGDGEGYFIPEDASDILKYIGQETSRAREIEKKIRTCKAYIKKLEASPCPTGL